MRNFFRDERQRIKKQKCGGDIAHLAHASDRMEGAERFMGFRGVPGRLDDSRRRDRANGHPESEIAPITSTFAVRQPLATASPDIQ
jgi:hypothetical protein